VGAIIGILTSSPATSATCCSQPPNDSIIGTNSICLNYVGRLFDGHPSFAQSHTVSPRVAPRFDM
jgi:hypothetical protein